MKYTRLLPLLVAAFLPAVSIADPVVEDFATIPNLGASTDIRGGLVLASDGNYYGTAGGDGTAGDAGSIFKMTPAGVVTTLVHFTGNGGAAPGNTPRGRMVEAPDGFLYGATSLGRNNVGDPMIPSSGTIFKVSKTGVFTSLVTFVKVTTTQPPETATSAYGASPFGDLALGADGLIYGTTTAGGINNQGTIWGLNPATGAFATVVQFGLTGADAPVGTFAGLVRGAGNLFYGVGYDGGSSNGGCIFSFQPGVGLQVLASFNGILGPNYGNRPAATLAFGADGKLYGTTTRGGLTGTNDGTTFRSSVSGAFEPLADLNANGISRTAVGLTLAADGNFYGIGQNDRKVFGMTPAGAITIVGVLPIASVPFAPWIAGADGNLYTAAAGHIYRLRFSTPLTPFAAWKQLHLGNAAAADNADPERDGLGALAEYGLNLFPENHDVQPPVSAFNYVEGRRLRLILQRDPTHNDITVEVLATDNLVTGPWTVIATSALGAPFTGPGYFAGETASSGIQTVEIRDIVNMTGLTKRFLKVRFTH
ncbi:MAG: choice-of-anchor tandem repeat GloVer-containing protein [Chthoniobacteraceae bacterium]